MNNYVVKGLNIEKVVNVSGFDRKRTTSSDIADRPLQEQIAVTLGYSIAGSLFSWCTVRLSACLCQNIQATKYLVDASSSETNIHSAYSSYSLLPGKSQWATHSHGWLIHVHTTVHNVCSLATTVLYIRLLSKITTIPANQILNKFRHVRTSKIHMRDCGIWPMSFKPTTSCCINLSLFCNPLTSALIILL